MTQISFPTTCKINNFPSLQKASESCCSRILQKIKEIWNKICAFFCCSRKKEERKLSQTNSVNTQAAATGTKTQLSEPINTTTSSTGTKPRLLNSQTKEKPSLSNMPTVLMHHTLGFLDYKDVIAFGKTCKAHQEAANSDVVWKSMIDHMGLNLPKPQGISQKEHFLSIAEKERFNRFHVYDQRRGKDKEEQGPIEYNIRFYKGIETVEEFREKVSLITGVPLEKLDRVIFSANATVDIIIKADGSVNIPYLSKMSEGEGDYFFQTPLAKAIKRKRREESPSGDKEIYVTIRQPRLNLI